MAAKAKDEKTFRLTDMKVEEVSLVDRPANRQPFLVVKRDSSMSTEVKTNADGDLVTKDQVTDGGRKDKVTVDKTQSNDDCISIGEAGAKMSKDVHAKLDDAIDKLSLQGALPPSQKKVVKRADGGGDKKAVNELNEKMDALHKKLDVQGDKLTEQSSTIDSLSTTVASQEATIKVLKAKPTSTSSGSGKLAHSQAIEVEVTKAVHSSAPDESWPADMNEPQPKHQF